MLGYTPFNDHNGTSRTIDYPRFDIEKTKANLWNM